MYEIFVAEAEYGLKQIREDAPIWGFPGTFYMAPMDKWEKIKVSIR